MKFVFCLILSILDLNFGYFWLVGKLAWFEFETKLIFILTYIVIFTIAGIAAAILISIRFLYLIAYKVLLFLLHFMCVLIQYLFVIIKT